MTPGSDTIHPWERLPNESGPAYAAFLIYRDLGAARSLYKVAQALASKKAKTDQPGHHEGTTGAPRGHHGGCVPSRFRRWARDHRWPERAFAYDHYLDQARARAAVKAVESHEAKLARLRQRHEDVVLAEAEGMHLKVLTMLKGELYTVTKETTTVSEDGHTTNIVQIIEPAGWRYRDIPILAREAASIEDRILNPRGSGGSNETPPPPPNISQAERDDRSGAQKKLDAWRAEARRSLVAAPSVAPGPPPDVEDPAEPPPAEAPAPADAVANGAGDPVHV